MALVGVDGAAAEPAAAVVAPAPDLAAGGDRAGVQLAGGDRGDRELRDNARRLGPRRLVAGLHLTGAVVTPAPQRGVVADRAGVPLAGRDRGEARGRGGRRDLRRLRLAAAPA